MQFTTVHTVIVGYIFDLTFGSVPEAFPNNDPSKCPPVFTKDSKFVLAVLDKLPELGHLRVFQKNYEARDDDPEVQRYYVAAGRVMLEAYKCLEQLKEYYRLGGRPTCAHFQKPALYIADCINIWYKSIGTDAFEETQLKRRAIRLQYIKYALAVVRALGKLIIPEIGEDWVEFLGDLLDADYFDEVFLLDSQETYIKRQAAFDGKVFLAPEFMPAFYVNKGTEVLRPYVVPNTMKYGFPLVRNEKCVRTGMHTVIENTVWFLLRNASLDPNLKDYMNVTRVNAGHISTSAVLTEGTSQSIFTEYE